jgi:hypothetical protein
MMARTRIPGVGIWLAIFSLLLPGSAQALCDYFSFHLDSRQVVPPVDSLGWGYSELQICQDDSLRGHITTYLEETITAVQIHGPANPGENGNLLYDLPVDQLVSVFVVGPVTAEQREWFRSHRMYADVHTTGHPEGAIRGQIITEGDAIAPTPWSSVKGLYQSWLPNRPLQPPAPRRGS